MNLLLSLRSELLKTRRTAAFYFTLIGAAVVPFMLLLNIASDGIPNEAKNAKNAINGMFHLNTEATGVAILPMFIILICTLLPQIEFRNVTWKQVLTSPQTRSDIYLAKFLKIQLMILLFLIANHLLIWVVVIASHFMLPSLNILSQSFDFLQVLRDSADAYLSILAICAIQFWIGLRSKNFIVPIAIGFACWFVGSILVFEYQSAAAPYFPYCFHAVRFSAVFRPLMTQIGWTSAGIALVVLIFGFWDFKRRKMGR